MNTVACRDFLRTDILKGARRTCTSYAMSEPLISRTSTPRSRTRISTGSTCRLSVSTRSSTNCTLVWKRYDQQRVLGFPRSLWPTVRAGRADTHSELSRWYGTHCPPSRSRSAGDSGPHQVRETMRNSATPRETMRDQNSWCVRLLDGRPDIAVSPKQIPKPGVAGSIPAEGAI
jgi:hypothetical protein